MSCENTSWPLPVVPSQLVAFGPRYGVNVVAVGEWGAISGANTATTMISPRTIIPVRALPLPHSVRTARPTKRSGPGTELAPPVGTRTVAPDASGGGMDVMTVMLHSGLAGRGGRRTGRRRRSRPAWRA